MNYDEAFLKQAYDKHSIHNRDEIERSSNCGCFACIGSFAASTVWDWVPPDTGSCPYCVMDTVIGDASKLPVTDEAFLRALNKLIFSFPQPWDQVKDPHPITGPGDWKPISPTGFILEPGYGKSNKNA